MSPASVLPLRATVRGPSDARAHGLQDCRDGIIGDLPPQRSLPEQAARGTGPRGLERTRRLMVLIAFFAVLGFSEITRSDENRSSPQPARPRVGRLVRIASPITDRVERRVRRAVEQLVSDTKFNPNTGEWPVLILQLTPGRSDFGKALDLARFLVSSKLNGVTTVAYLPETVRGHALLVALACDEIAMASDAQIGDAGMNEDSIGPAIRSGYVEIAERRGKVPRDLVLGMLDPALEVLEVETDVSREFILSSRLDELRKQKAVGVPKVLIPAGEAGLFTGREARELGLVRYLADDRAAVARALNLPRESVEEDPAREGTWRPIRIDVKGPINSRMVEQLEKAIDRQIRDKAANFVCVWLNSPGGAPDDSQRLANYLLTLDSAEVRTVAYVESEARADAVMIALACDHLVMRPASILGGPGAFEIPKEEIDYYAAAAAGIARNKARSPSLAASFIDPNLDVYRFVRRDDGMIDFFSEADVAARDDAESWQRQDAVTRAGQPLQVNGNQAVELNLAYAVVDDFAAFKNLYGLGSDPALVEPGWADLVIDRLSSPLATGSLLVLAMLGLYFELQHPGLGLGGFVAGVSFLIFFWAHYLGGTAGWLEGMLFLAGITCLLLEIFVLPGFGVFGIGGGALVVASLVLASQTFVLPQNDYQLSQLRNSLFVVVAAGVVFVGLSALFRRLLPAAPVLNQVILEPPSGEALEMLTRREAVARYDHLLGRQGTAATRLSPAGKVRIDDKLFHVVTDGELIEKGQSVVVIAARGNHVVVTETKGENLA